MISYSLIGATMDVETPSTFFLKLENGHTFLVELDGGSWMLRAGSNVKLPPFSPNLGHAKLSCWEAVKRAWSRIDEAYTKLESQP